MSPLVESFDSLLLSRGYSYSTRQAYTRWISKLQEHFPSRELESLDSNDVHGFITHLQTKRYKDTSCRQAVQAIRFLYRELLRREDIPDFPSLSQKLSLPQLPTQAEVLLIVDRVAKPALKLMFQLIYGLGLELQEARNLQVANIDLASHTVKFRTNRTAKHRTIRLPSVTLEVLSQQIVGKAQKELIFTAHGPNPYSDAGIQRAWAAARKLAGIGPHATIRSLRHCYIWHLELLGVKLFDILASVGIQLERAVPYYSAYHTSDLNIGFSPLDRRVDESTNKSSRKIPYVSETRILQILSIRDPRFDFSKLVSLLHELNIASSVGNLYSVAMLVRAVIDHVPPVFGHDRFTMLANNYSGTRSFKESMLNLDGALRLIANSYLHTCIREFEEHPNSQQVDFRAQVDQLLSELVRVSN